jgi:hypothetical protein
MRPSALALAAASLVFAACSWFEDPAPNEARLTIDGVAGSTVRLIVSSKFVAAVNERGQTTVVLFEADTLVTTLPFNRVYRIEKDQRFFAETTREDADLPNIHMQVFVDNRRQFNEVGALVPGQPYRFVYTYNQVITREIVVL